MGSEYITLIAERFVTASPNERVDSRMAPCLTKAKLQDILRILARGGAKLGSRLTDKKKVLAQRLAHWLNRAIEAGRAAPGSVSDGE